MKKIKGFVSFYYLGFDVSLETVEECKVVGVHFSNTMPNPIDVMVQLSEFPKGTYCHVFTGETSECLSRCFFEFDDKLTMFGGFDTNV